MGTPVDDAKQQAQKVLDDNYVAQPPVRVTDLAANYGLSVQVADLGTYGPDVAGYIDPVRRVIVVNKNDPPTRQAFTVGHELGHWLMHQSALRQETDKYAILYRKPLGDPTPDIIEKQANTFAACLLVPPAMLERYRDITDQQALADIFGVSQDVIGYSLQHAQKTQQ